MRFLLSLTPSLNLPQIQTTLKSSQKLRHQKSRTLCLKSRTAVSKIHPQPTCLQAWKLHPPCNDLGQPHNFHEPCAVSCHYRRMADPSDTNRRRETCKCSHGVTSNTGHLQHAPVRHQARRRWKDPAPRRSADPAGTGVRVWFHGNDKTGGQEQTCHADEPNCCQGK